MSNQPVGTGVKKINILIAYFLIYVVWGSTYFFIGVALKGFPPFLLGALRFSMAGLILLAICYLRKEPVLKSSLIKKSAISGIVLLFIILDCVYTSTCQSIQPQSDAANLYRGLEGGKLFCVSGRNTSPTLEV